EVFNVPLRLGEGFNEQHFNDLCTVLRFCAREWAQEPAIPKVAVNVLVDLFPAIESCSHLAFYQGAESQHIRDAALMISDLVRECVAVSADHHEAARERGTTSRPSK